MLKRWRTERGEVGRGGGGVELLTRDLVQRRVEKSPGLRGHLQTEGLIEQPNLQRIVLRRLGGLRKVVDD
jgi:hypothetical protein